ncbi:hypothetical protein G5211_00070 [Escherichia phage vB_EcoM_G5211]|nr:hypothetical protein G5211_00070 [Escherichia phage vB_EcoM_G5211]
MFISSATPVKVYGETVYLPAGYCYVIVDRHGVVYAFKGRPVEIDSEYGTWGYKAAYMDIPDLGVRLGRFDNDVNPCLIKYASYGKTVKPNSVGWIDDGVNVK